MGAWCSLRSGAGSESFVPLVLSTIFYPKAFFPAVKALTFLGTEFLLCSFCLGRGDGVDAELQWPSSFSDIFLFSVLLKISVVSASNILSPSAAQRASAHSVVFRHLIPYTVLSFCF